jgi:hypothetical protein
MEQIYELYVILYMKKHSVIKLRFMEHGANMNPTLNTYVKTWLE